MKSARRTGDRLTVWGAALLVVWLGSCYGWHPVVALVVGCGAALLTAWWIDGRPGR